MTPRPDILVLGGGPAGASFAALAAEAGAKVVLIERERFPRDKVCGEFLSPAACRSLERLGVLQSLRSSGAASMDACRITDPRGRAIEAGLPDLPELGCDALGVSRFLLDSTLLDLARRKGVDVRERYEATAPILENGSVRGVSARPVGSGRAPEPLRAGVVVAADGRRSMLARALHPELGDPRTTRRSSWFALKTHLEGGAERPERRVELHLFPGGYAGLGTVEGGRINLCLMVTAGALRECGGSRDRVLAERVLANPAARDLLSRARPVSSWKSVGPLRFGPRRPAAAGALFLGDAAGTIDPLVGEGMAHALASAVLALPLAIDAAAMGGVTPDLARRYERRWREAFGGVTRAARRIGWLFERPALAGVALALLGRVRGPILAGLVASTRSGGGPALTWR